MESDLLCNKRKDPAGNIMASYLVSREKDSILAIKMLGFNPLFLSFALVCLAYPLNYRTLLHLILVQEETTYDLLPVWL